MRRFIILLLLISAAAPAIASTRWLAQTSPSNKILKGVSASNPAGVIIAVGDEQTIITSEGSSWRYGNLAENSNYTCSAVHFPNSNTGYIAGHSNIGGGNRARFWKSTDGGTTWTSSQTLIPGGFEGLDLRELYDVYFINNDRGWVVGQTDVTGSYAVVYRTDDGGNNWYAKREMTLGQIAAVNYYGIHFVDSNIGWLVGEGGRIYKTLSGGDIWEAQTSGTANDLNDVFFVNSSTGWVVGNAKTILKTTNGGNNWTSINVPFLSSDHNLTAIHFVDANNGWACGYDPSNPFIIKTTDGGNNWSLETLPSGLSGTQLNSIYFTDQYNGWAVGGGSSVILKYVVDPAITSVTPSARYQGWSGNIVLTGTNFQSGVNVTVTRAGGSGFNYSYTRDNSTQITILATLDATATTGDWIITVTNPDGGSAAIAFTVNPPPTLTSVTRYHPTYGAISWDTQGALSRLVTIEGANFQNGAIITFTGNVTVSATTFIDSTKLTARISIPTDEVVGFKNVTITNPDAGSYTLTNAFEIRQNSIGPTITIAEVTNVVETSSKKFVDFPRFTAIVEDPTGLNENTIRFSVFIPSPPGFSPEYYWTFSPGAPGYFIPLEQTGSLVTKARVTATLRNLKDFTTDKEYPVNAVLTSYRPLYVYAEDENTNPSSLLYDTVFCDFRPLPPGGSEGLTSGVATPDRNTIVIQFESDLEIDAAQLQALVNSPTGLISNHMVTVRKVGTSSASSFIAAQQAGRKIYKAILSLTDFYQEALPLGIYRIILRHPQYGIVAKTKAVMVAPGMTP